MDIQFNDVENFLAHPLDPFAIPEQTFVFEAELAHVFGVKEAIAVSSGTAAIHCALAALDIGPGDEVLVPALSVIMSIVPVLYQNAKPVFVDSEPGRVDFDYLDLERKISPKVRAIIPVYLWGCSYNMPRLISFAEKHQIAVIEDACQAHGTRWDGKYLGTLGSLGCFSMRDGKLLSTGEGGFILTNDVTLAQRCRAFRSHWGDTQNAELSYNRLGWNYRLTELQALLACHQLSNFDEILRRRHRQTQYVLTKLTNLPCVEPYSYNDNEEPNLFSPVLLIRKQFATRRVAQELSKRGVVNSVGTFGMRPAQEWGVFQELIETVHQVQGGNRVAALTTPNTARFLDRVLALILLPQYSEAELDGIIGKVKAVLTEIVRTR